MSKKGQAALAYNADTHEELIGILTAISIVSKRLAKKLAMLEELPPAKREEARDA